MLNINELNEKDRARARQNHETYKILYEKCANHIRRRHALGHKYTTWKVDGIVIGRPIYTYEHALRYIVEKLRKGGFEAYIDQETLDLVISWGKKKKKESNKKSSSSKSKERDVRKASVSNDIVSAWMNDSSTIPKSKKKRGTSSTGDSLEMRLKRLNAQIQI